MTVSYQVKHYSDTASTFVEHDIIEVVPSPYETHSVRDFFLRKRLYHEVISIKKLEEEAMQLNMLHHLNASEDDAVSEGDYKAASLRKDLVRLLTVPTLEAIIATFGGGNHYGMVNWINKCSPFPEVKLRESISYYGVLNDYDMTPRAISNALDNVRHLEEFRFEDLSTLEGSARERAALAMKLVMILNNASATRLTHQQVSILRCEQLSKELLDIVEGNPEQLEQITDYIISRGIKEFTAADRDALNSYLSTGSAISSGCL